MVAPITRSSSRGQYRPSSSGVDRYLQLNSGDFLHDVSWHSVEHVEQGFVRKARDFIFDLTRVVYGVALWKSELGL